MFVQNNILFEVSEMNTVWLLQTNITIMDVCVCQMVYDWRYEFSIDL